MPGESALPHVSNMGGASTHSSRRSEMTRGDEPSCPNYHDAELTDRFSGAMIMKSTLLIAVTAVLLVGAQAGQNDSAIKDVREAIGVLNDAFAKHDADAIRRLMTDEHLSITSYY